MPPHPSNSLICSVFLVLAAASPRQCERLEPPARTVYSRCTVYLLLKHLAQQVAHGLSIANVDQ